MKDAVVLRSREAIDYINRCDQNLTAALNVVQTRARFPEEAIEYLLKARWRIDQAIHVLEPPAEVKPWA